MSRDPRNQKKYVGSYETIFLVSKTKTKIAVDCSIDAGNGACGASVISPLPNFP